MTSMVSRVASLPGFRRLAWIQPLRAVPRPLQLAVAEMLANRVLAEQIEDGELDFLDGLIVRLRVTDLGYDWGISKLGQRLVFIPGDKGVAEGTIAGDSRELLLLMSRRADADTLFFQRRLVLEGNTELGLQVKNLVDSIDLDELPPTFNRAVVLGADVAGAVD